MPIAKTTKASKIQSALQDFPEEFMKSPQLLIYRGVRNENISKLFRFDAKLLCFGFVSSRFESSSSVKNFVSLCAGNLTIKGSTHPM